MGVDRAVLVQAHGAYGTDNAYVLDAVAAAPDRFVSVVIVDPDDADPPATLRTLADVPGCAGVRLFGIGPTAPAWFDGAGRRRAVGRPRPSSGSGSSPRCSRRSCPRLRRMLERFPDVPVVLDHCGFPDLSGGPPYPGAASLLALAGFASLHLKVTSHVLEDAEARASGGAASFVERVHAEFGADRLVWGSDYPQTHDRPYAALVALGRDACAGLPAVDRDLFLGGNALRLWPALTA